MYSSQEVSAATSAKPPELETTSKVGTLNGRTVEPGPEDERVAQLAGCSRTRSSGGYLVGWMCCEDPFSGVCIRHRMSPYQGWSQIRFCPCC